MLHKLRWFPNSVLRSKSSTLLCFVKLLMIVVLYIWKNTFPHFQPHTSLARGLWCYTRTMGQTQCPLHCVPVSVPRCPDEGTDGGHHGFFLEFLTGFPPVETRVGRGVSSDACWLSVMCCQGTGTTAQRHPHGCPDRCLTSQRMYHSKSLSLAKTKFNQLQRMLWGSLVV